MRGPSALSLSKLPSRRTNAIVVDISLPAAAVAKVAYESSAGMGSGSDDVIRLGIEPPSRARRSCR